MNDRLDAALLDDAPDEVLIADIALDELGLARHGLRQARGKVVENDGSLAGVQELESHMAADVSRPAGHKNCHLLSPFWRKCRRLLVEAADVSMSVHAYHASTAPVNVQAFTSQQQRRACPATSSASARPSSP